MSPEIPTILSYRSMDLRRCLAAPAGQETGAESPAGPLEEPSAGPARPAAAEEIAWLQALHAVRLCQRVAELTARR